MKPHIPHPLDVQREPIAVFVVAPAVHAFAGPDADSATCRSRWELGHLASDLVTVASPRWVGWAVSEALAGRLPRTQCYMAPMLTGGGTWDLGRGPHPLPMIFDGPTCDPDWPDGEGCDDPDPAALPDHAALSPRRKPWAEEVGDVVFDDFEAIDFPFIVCDEGATA